MGAGCFVIEIKNSSVYIDKTENRKQDTAKRCTKKQVLNAIYVKYSTNIVLL